MADELIVTMPQLPEIDANFEEINEQLTNYLKQYNAVVYSDDAAEKLKQMKEDRKNLGNLKSSIDAKRKEVKKSYLAPYDEFETKVKKLLEKIEEPRELIDSKIKELEEAARENKRKEIRDYFNSIAIAIDDEFKENLFLLLYDSRWENVSSTAKAYKEGLKKGVDNYTLGIKMLEALSSDFYEDGLRELKATLNIEKAVDVIKEKEKQREELLKREKEKLEAERERIRLEEEVRAAKQLEAQREQLRQELDARALQTQTDNVAVADNEPKASSLLDAFDTSVTAENTDSKAENSNFSKPEITEGNSSVRVSETDTTDTAAMVKVLFAPEDWKMISHYADRMEIEYKLL